MMNIPTMEYCMNCGKEVLVESGGKPTHCPRCGTRVMSCSTCTLEHCDWDGHKCSREIIINEADKALERLGKNDV